MITLYWVDLVMGAGLAGGLSACADVLFLFVVVDWQDRRAKR